VELFLQQGSMLEQDLRQLVLGQQLLWGEQEQRLELLLLV
jgi:hypothetical protein